MDDEQTPAQQAPARRRRGVAALAAYAGGAMTALGALGVGILIGEVLLARRTIPGAEAPPPRSSGRYATDFPGPDLRLAVIGDSTAAGYGVPTRAETPGALLATWIAEAAQRPVRLTCPAVVGSVSAWLPGQVEAVVDAGADLAIIFIGANDVTTRTSDAVAVRHLADAVSQLRASGAEVVVATCPDLGTIRPIQPPLRWLARRWSRQLAAAQTVAVVRAGGRTVSLVDLLGPQFAAAPDRMFGLDRFHPSAEGYVAAATVILPAALAALGLAPERPRPSTPRPLPAVAAAAARVGGREVTPATVLGSSPRSGPRSGSTRRHSDASTRTPRLRNRVPSVRMTGAPAPSTAE